MRKIVFVSVGALVAACSSAPVENVGGPSGSGPNGSATLHAGTHVMSQSIDDLVIVEATQITFPSAAWDALQHANAGEVLLGDRQSPGSSGKNPDGYLRTIQSITHAPDGTVVVATSAATLQQAVDSLKFQGTLQPQSVSYADLKGGTTIKLLDFSGTKLLDTTANVTVNNQTVGYHAFATVTTGTLNFAPSYDVGADLAFLTINSFHATATGELDATLLVDAGVQLQTTLDNQTFTQLVAQKVFGSKSTTVADYDVNLGSLDVGPFKMPSSAHFTATLACDFAWGGGVEVKVGGTAKASITAGIQYANGALSPIFDKSGDLSQTGPDWTVDGATRAYCSIQPQITLNFFGVAMTQLTATGYAGLGGSVVCGGKDANQNQLALMHGDAEAGVSASILAKVDLFGLYKWQKQCTLFDYDTEWQKDDAFVLPGGSQATCSMSNDYSLPPKPPVNPSACFSDAPTDGGTDGGADSADGSSIIQGACTHDVCTAGDKLGQQCDACTMKVCAKDPYCCDTYWGLSCFQDVQDLCGQTCP